MEQPNSLKTKVVGNDKPLVNSVERVTGLVRDAIVSGEFSPGSRIKVSGLSSRYQVSTMPVREALRTLEGEGLVFITPNRGATVRRVDRKFIEDVYEIRGHIESLMVRRCVARLTAGKLERLEELNRDHERAVEDGQLPAIVNANRQLHVELITIAGNEEAIRIFRHGWGLIHALRLRYGYRAGRLTQLIKEHRLLLDALWRLDADYAEAILRMHNYSGMEDILEMLTLCGQEPADDSQISARGVNSPGCSHRGGGY